MLGFNDNIPTKELFIFLKYNLVPQDGEDAGIRQGKDRAGARSLRAQQGYQVGPELKEGAQFRRGDGDRQFL